MSYRPVAYIVPMLVLLMLAGGCGATRRMLTVDSETAEAASSARAAFDSGSIEEAARLYALALHQARLMDRSPMIAMYAQNLAACFLLMGKPGEARPLLDEAAIEYRRSNMPTLDVSLLKAKVARLQGNLDEADWFAGEVLDNLGADRVEYEVQAHILKVHIACDRGDASAAGAQMNRVTEILPRIQSQAILAAAAGASGRTLALKKEFAAAGSEFDREVDISRDSGLFGEMSLALVNAAGSYREAGMRTEALDRFYQAGRSLEAQGKHAEALRAAEDALDVAGPSYPPELIRQVESLLVEIKEKVGPQAAELRPEE